MLLRDAVGGHPERTGSEEVRRPKAKGIAQPRPFRAQRLPVSRPGLSSPHALVRRRFRLQAAGILALALIGLLAIALPARTVHIAVDGETRTVSSRTVRDAGAVEEAGVDLRAGDAVRDAGGQLVVDRATEAMLYADGKTYTMRSQADSISELLSQAGIPLEAEDSVLRNGVFVSASAPVAPEPSLASLLGGPSSESGQHLAAQNESVLVQVRRAVPFTVIENGQQLELSSSRETVATALRNAGVRLGPGDEVQPPLDTELTAGVAVHVRHAQQMVVTLPEGKSIVYSLEDTVGDAIAASGIPMPADFRLDPPADTPVSAGIAVHVVGISQEQALEIERIESATVYEADPSLAYGQRRVVQGQDGVHYFQYNLVYENGEVVSRELASDWYDPEPADTIIYYSTADAAPAPAQLDVPDGMNIVGSLSVYATWYNPASAGRPPSDPSYGITATGVPVDRGIVAVDPSVIPLGTRLYIPGYGYAVAADTGGGIRGNVIDLGYPDGVTPDWISHWVDIYILGP
ncbi:MAG: ubiquitin-like domain-containing protein [Dehalococcoidia bacterium]